LIGKAIKEYREKRGLSIKELGRRCGFGSDGERIIEAFERDEGFPDLEKLKKVAEVLWVPLEVLCPVPCRECPFEKKIKEEQFI
jgi:DNA-binding helix-turn-helix protein